MVSAQFFLKWSEIIRSRKFSIFWQKCVGTANYNITLRSVLKQIDLVLFFFSLIESFASCLHLLNNEASKWFKPAKEIALLVLVAGFTFAGHLSYWISYDLKEQLSKLALWNIHWSTVHILGQRFVLVLSHEYEQKAFRELACCQDIC